MAISTRSAGYKIRAADWNEVVNQVNTNTTNITNTYPANDNSWTYPSLPSGWYTYDSYSGIRIRKMGNGLVVLAGAAYGSSLSSGSVLFTLPTGYRPAASSLVSGVYGTWGTRFIISTSGGISTVQINTSGQVLTTSTISDCQFGSTTFLAEA